jgi:dihydrofolate reductase
MRNVVLYIATSIDGYIARGDGSLDWLENADSAEEDYGYEEFFDSIDTTLMGNATYRQILSFDVEFPYKGKDNYVFTRGEAEETPQATVTNRNPRELVRELKKREGADIWLVGGGSLNGELLRADLIDRMIITIIPVVLGEGVPLFAGAAPELPWTLTEADAYDSGFLQLTYERRAFVALG